MGKRAYEIARELHVPLREVRGVMVELGLYLSAATPLTQEQVHGIVSRLEVSEHGHDASEDHHDTNG